GNMERSTGSVIDADAVGSIAVGEQPAAAPGDATPTTPAQPVAPSLDDLEASLQSVAAPAPQPAPAPAQ
ncbi:MAG: preprotein translocase subunit SecG, partial [Caulobacteraceae bacterium]